MKNKEKLVNFVNKVKEESKLSAKLSKFKFPKTLKKADKKANKNPKLIVCQYLTNNQNVKFMNAKIVAGNCIVINNKVHMLDPSKLWRCGKIGWYIFREYDRRPIANDTYAETKILGYDTDADAALIKVMLGAINKPAAALKNKNYLIIGGIALVALFVIFKFAAG